MAKKKNEEFVVDHIGVTLPMEYYEYFKKNEWKIRAYDDLLKTLERNNTSIRVDECGRIELQPGSTDWGIGVDARSEEQWKK